MTKRNKRTAKPERRISIRSVQREEPDVRKMAQVLLRLVAAQTEADAEAEHHRRGITGTTVKTKPAVTTPGSSEGRDER